MQVQTSFYKNLYAEKFQFNERSGELNDFCNDIVIPKLSDEDAESCERDISEEEISNALKIMKNTSAPGHDSLTTSFHEVFWSRIKLLLIESFKEAFRTGSLSITQRRA